MGKKEKDAAVWPALEIAEALKKALAYRGREQDAALTSLRKAILEECARKDDDFGRRQGEE